MENDFSKKLVAEAFGTFVLVFFAVGVSVITRSNLVATALAFGLVIIALAYAIGNISGCHINPAVSFAMYLRKKLSFKEFWLYSAAQLIGATIAAIVLYLLVGMFYGFVIFETTGFVWGTNSVPTISGGSFFDNLLVVISGFKIEVILTFVFVYAILGAVNKKNFNSAPFVIGLALTLVHLLGIGLTGTSVNPARSFGVAIISPFFGAGFGSLWQILIFLTAPMSGAFLATMFYDWLNEKEKI